MAAECSYSEPDRIEGTDTRVQRSLAATPTSTNPYLRTRACPAVAGTVKTEQMRSEVAKYAAGACSEPPDRVSSADSRPHRQSKSRISGVEPESVQDEGARRVTSRVGCLPFVAGGAWAAASAGSGSSELEGDSYEVHSEGA